MNRKEFGKLLTILRKQHRDLYGNTFTQAKLAEETGLSEIVIGNLERGTKEKLDADILLKLANAFNLTTQERKEFVLAATNIDETLLYSAEAFVPKVLDTFLPLLEQLHSPAFLADSFGDLIGINPLALAVYNLPSRFFQKTPENASTRPNFLRLLFGQEFEDRRNMMGETWPAFAHQTILLFRVAVFSYQAHPYFQEQLLPELNKSSLFRKFWQSPHTEEDCLFTNFSDITLNHPEWGPLKFVSSPLQATTPFGTLTLYAFHARGLETAKTCFKIVEKTGTEAISLAPWPNPSFLEEVPLF